MSLNASQNLYVEVLVTEFLNMSHQEVDQIMQSFTMITGMRQNDKL